MNSRQIRDAVTMARQLALYKKERMNYSHPNYVIQPGPKIKNYRLQIHEGAIGDQIAREDGLREL
jgi:hypothetical protein